MCASDCSSRLPSAVPGRHPRKPHRAPLGAATPSAVRVDLARAGGVALRRGALGVGRVGPALGLALEALRLGLELVGLGVAALGLGAAGAGLDAPLALGAGALAARRQGKQHDQQDDDCDDDDDQCGAHRQVLLSGWLRGSTRPAAASLAAGAGSAVADAHERRRRMAPLDIETALDWRGRTVVDRDGDKIGKFDELYLDEDDRPAWGAVTTGLFGMRQTFVPLSEAQADGDVLRVPFGKEMVKDAPNVDPETQLSPDEEDLLYRHYGLGGGGTGGGGRADAPVCGETARRDHAGVGDDGGAREEAVAGNEAVARDESVAREDAAPRDHAAPAAGGDGDRDGEGEGEGAEMIRSEEEVEVGTRRRVAGKARLKKYVVTEHVQKVVPVQREEVRVEFEAAEGDAPGEQGRGAAPGAADPAADDAAADRGPVRE